MFWKIHELSGLGWGCFVMIIFDTLPFIPSPRGRGDIRSPQQKKAGLPARLLYFIEILSLLCLWINAYLQPRPVFPFKIHHTINQGKEGIIRSFADINPGVELRPPLPYQNISCTNELPAEPFDAKALGLAVPAVS
jgi:hypothetical protein